MRGAFPLSAYRLAKTRDAEELRTSFARIYGRPVMDFTGRDRSFQAIINHCRLRHIELNYGTYAGHLRFQFPESIFVSQIFPVRGAGEAVVEGQSVSIDRANSVLVSSNVPLAITGDSDYERVILCIRSESLHGMLAALTGKTIGAPIRVAPARGLLDVPGRLLRDQVMFLTSQLSASTALPEPVVAEFEQALMVSFLRTNRHTYSHLFEAEPPDAGLLHVRRAEEFIEAHWREAITVEDLARVTGASVLALYRSFRRHRGCSPTDFIRTLRLRQQSPTS